MAIISKTTEIGAGLGSELNEVRTKWRIFGITVFEFSQKKLFKDNRTGPRPQ